MGWFLVGAGAQAAAGFASMLVTRWGFRSWPSGSYTWIPVILDLAGLVLVLLVARALSSRGLSWTLVLGAWLVGRIGGVLSGALVPGVGLDAGLVSRATFGLPVAGQGGLAVGFGQLLPLTAQLVIMTLGYAWGRLGLDGSGREHVR